jgi:lipopolysaccharide biosynthesis glycosyltransferase
MRELHVACAAEGARYVAHSAAMLHSVLETHPEHRVHVHYMHGPDVTADQEDRLTKMIEAAGGQVDFIHVPDPQLEGLPTRGFTRKATWYRIFLPELRPALDRVIYLDADLIVVDSLDDLWETDLAGNLLGAVTNVFERHYEHRPAELGLAGPHVYFNAGVLVMDLEGMRHAGTTAELFDYGVRHAPELAWRDQDTLNVVLGDCRLALHPRWNCMNSFWVMPWAADVFGADALADAKRNPAIRHFEGPDRNKPWHARADRDLRALYAHHRRATPWPRRWVEGGRARTIAGRTLRRAGLK